MKRIAIVGGGISGLAAAFALEERRLAGAELHYVLFERSKNFGGVLRTERVDGCLLEAGPDSFLTEKPWAADLCRKLGIGDQLVGSNDGARKTYILVKGQLVEMPDGLMFMVPTKILAAATSSLFSASTKLRMAQEWFHPPRKASEDESVAALVERHYGSEVVDRLADPLLSGVYGGDAAHLSVRAVMPRFAEMEATYGSLGRALIAARKKIPAMKGAKPPLFTSLQNGMQQLVDALLARLPQESLQTDSFVQAVIPEESGWTVSAGLQSDHFDAVIIATPTPITADLLHIASPELETELDHITYSSSVTVALGYGQDIRKSLPAGFGFLVPRSEGKRMLAATFVHNKFHGRAPADRAMIRCFLGGTRDQAILDLSEGEILHSVREELQQILGLTAEPLFTRVYKWKGAMAQYNVGHLERLARIENLRRQLPGLALAGNGYRGIGVPDCVRSGQQAVTEVMEFLEVPQSVSPSAG